MKNLTICCPNGSRVTLAVDERQFLVQILEEACKKKGFLATEHGLRFQGRFLDLSQQVQYFSLPNNCALEMLKKVVHVSSEVDIAVQLLDGTRKQQTFHPDTTLWSLLEKLDVVAHISAASSESAESLTVPVAQYMNSHVLGEIALRHKTLKMLGIISGKALIRVSTRVVPLADVERANAEVSDFVAQQKRLDEGFEKKLSANVEWARELKQLNGATAASAQEEPSLQLRIGNGTLQQANVSKATNEEALHSLPLATSFAFRVRISPSTACQTCIAIGKRCFVTAHHMFVDKRNHPISAIHVFDFHRVEHKAVVLFAIDHLDLCFLGLSESAFSEPADLVAEAPQFGEVTFTAGFPLRSSDKPDVNKGSVSQAGHSVRFSDSFDSGLRFKVFPASEGVFSGGLVLNVFGEWLGMQSKTTFDVAEGINGTAAAYCVPSLGGIVDWFKVCVLEKEEALSKKNAKPALFSRSAAEGGRVSKKMDITAPSDT